MPPSSLESTSSSQAPTMFTPDSDSDDSVNDFGNRDGRQASFKMIEPRRDGGWGRKGRSMMVEKGDARFPEEEEDGMYAGGDEGYESAETSRSYRLYTPDEEKAVVRKFDRRLVGFVAFLYMLSFLDRSNIGNARIAGLAGDLKLSSNQYEWVLTAFYMSYIAFEPLSILWNGKIIPAHILITIIVLSWGLIASLQSVVRSFTGLFILRLLLGIGEAGFTGIPFYMSFFFKREELALRTGLFVSAAPLATSFASSLGYLIMMLSKYIHIAPWRLLFLLEGFPSVIVSVFAWYQIPDGPSTAHYLTKRQKRIARLRLRKEKTSATADGESLKARFKELAEAIKDPKIWTTAIMFFCTNMAFSSLPAYLPQILEEMDHSIAASQALSAPPYLLAFFTVIFTAYLSDRIQNRSTFIIFHALLSALGYLIIAIAGLYHWSNWVRYAAVYPAAIGFFSVITIIITWNINNQKDEGKQGLAHAMLQLIGQCGPLLGTRLYPQSDAPLYVKGMSTCCLAMVMVAALALGLKFYLKRENRRNDVYERVGVDDDADENLVVKNDRIGNSNRFTYMI